jgi:hypothetical protein
VGWKKLSESEAFSEGSALWFVGDLESSLWAQKINWYLNFQFRKAKAHEPRSIPKELSTILQTWEVDAPSIKLSSQAPLLIESSKLLPNKMTVQISARTFNQWLEEAKDVWISLQKPPVRLFLPRGKSASDVGPAWSDQFEGMIVEE